MTVKEISEYITFPRTFEKYRWYKPILVFIIGAIIYLILNLILIAVFSAIYGENIMAQLLRGGYEVMNSEIGEIYSHLAIAIMIPSLYLATKIVKDRPFSSYSSSRGGWNTQLYLKAFIIPFILFLVVGIIEHAILGNVGNYHFTILFFIILLNSPSHNLWIHPRIQWYRKHWDNNFRFSNGIFSMESQWSGSQFRIPYCK